MTTTMPSTPSQLTFSITSRLMKNYESGSPISQNREIAIAQDINGNFLFFSIGNDQHLYLIAKDPGSEKGWKQQDLSQELGTTIEVLHIATTQDMHEQPILVAAMRDTTRPTTTLLYHCQQFGLAASPSRWVPRGNIQDAEVTHITTGATKAGQVLIAISTQKGDQATSYLINPDPADSSWLMKEVPVPIQSIGVHAIGIGHNASIERVQGVEALLYTLLKIDDTTSQLIVTSLPDFTFYNHEVPLASNPTILGLLAQQSVESTLFVGSKQLYVLSPHLQLSRDPDEVKNNSVLVNQAPFDYPITNIVNARNKSGQLEAWVLTQDGKLYFSQEQSAGQWSSPFLLEHNLTQMTARRNQQTNLIDLFVVNADNQLVHLWQDLVTTRWKEQQIVLAGVDNALEFTSYTTKIVLKDSDGVGVADSPLTIRTSELTQVTINGETYFVDQQADAVQCSTDMLGQITITTKVTSLVSPVIRIEGAALNKVIDIDPVAEIRARLATMTVQDMQNAQMQTSDSTIFEPLFKERRDIEGAHQAIQAMVKLQGQIPAQASGFNASVAGADVATGGVLIKDQGSAFSDKLSVDTLPADYGWHLDLTGATPAFSTQIPTDPATLSSGHSASTDDIVGFIQGGTAEIVEQTFGDIWHRITSGITEATHLVVQKVEGGLSIVIHWAEGAFRAVIQFAEQVWDVIEYVLEKIGVLFEDLVRWLGFIFQWQDILRTHRVLVTLFNLTIDYSEQQLSGAEQSINAFFSTAREKVLGQNLADKLGDAGNQRVRAAGNQPNFLSDMPPEVSWIFDHLESFFSGGEPTLDAGNVLALIPANAIATAEAMVQQFEGVVTDIANNFASLSLADLVKKIVGLVEATVLEAAETIAVGLLDAAKFMLQVLKSGLSKEWDIPLLAPLYKTYIAPGSALSILDAICLIASIPATIAYKLAMNEVPFSEDETNALTNAPTWQALLQIFASYHASRPVAQSREMDTTGLQMADGTSQSPPTGSVIASYIFGFIDACCTLGVGILDILLQNVEEESEGLSKAVKIKLIQVVLTGVVAAVCIADQALYVAYLSTSLTDFEFGITAGMVLFEVFFYVLELYGGDDIEKLLIVGKALYGVIFVSLAIGLYEAEEIQQDEEVPVLNALKLSQNVTFCVDHLFDYLYYFAKKQKKEAWLAVSAAVKGGFASAVFALHLARLVLVIQSYTPRPASEAGADTSISGAIPTSKAIMHRNR